MNLKDVLMSFKEPELQYISRNSTGRFSVNFKKFIPEFKNKPTKYLEIGVYSGKTTSWMLDNVLTHKDSFACCIDPWDLFEENLRNPRYHMNLVMARLDKMKRIYKDKLELNKGFSEIVLRDPKFTPNMFDIIYIDGYHIVQNVLRDYILSWPLLKIGGIMIFDDYLANHSNQVMMAVDFILKSLGRIRTTRHRRGSKYKLLFKNIQVGIKKWAE